MRHRIPEQHLPGAIDLNVEATRRGRGERSTLDGKGHDSNLPSRGIVVLSDEVDRVEQATDRRSSKWGAVDHLEENIAVRLDHENGGLAEVLGLVVLDRVRDEEPPVAHGVGW